VAGFAAPARDSVHHVAPAELIVIWLAFLAGVVWVLCAGGEARLLDKTVEGLYVYLADPGVAHGRRTHETVILTRPAVALAAVVSALLAGAVGNALALSLRRTFVLGRAIATGPTATVRATVFQGALGRAAFRVQTDSGRSATTILAAGGAVLEFLAEAVAAFACVKVRAGNADIIAARVEGEA